VQIKRIYPRIYTAPAFYLHMNGDCIAVKKFQKQVEKSKLQDRIGHASIKQFISCVYIPVLGNLIFCMAVFQHVHNSTTMATITQLLQLQWVSLFFIVVGAILTQLNNFSDCSIFTRNVCYTKWKSKNCKTA